MKLLKRFAIILSFILVPITSHSFTGLESSILPQVTTDWGLKIIVLNVGQADAILVMTPNGEIALIDSAKYKNKGHMIADILSNPALNGVGTINTIDLVYTTHYDADHIGGLPGIIEKGIRIRKAYDQGLSVGREMVTSSGNPTYYAKYCSSVGDINNNYIQDTNESAFVRHKIHYNQIETLGTTDQVEIRCVAVRGDTEGTMYDHALDISSNDINENPGSIALLIRLGDFEFYTAGDQTDNDWKSEEAIEESVLNSGAIVGGNDIDVIKVSHHGSDTSTSKALAEQMLPEVAIISTKWTGRDKLPKKTSLKQFQDNDTYVLITGDGLNQDENDAVNYMDYTQSAHTADNAFVASTDAIFNDQGNITILVSKDGSRYTVVGASFAKTFSTIDTDNQRSGN